MRMEARIIWSEVQPRILILAQERPLVSWLAATVLGPSGLAWRVESAVPDSPEAEVVLYALGPALARGPAAQALAESWRLPVLVLLGRDVEDQAALGQAGVIPLRWPHAPIQVQEALLRALGLDPGQLRLEPPGAPHIQRVKELG